MSRSECVPFHVHRDFVHAAERLLARVKKVQMSFEAAQDAISLDAKISDFYKIGVYSNQEAQGLANAARVINKTYY
jgi:hypothetical protein